jgi:hypothetical protein
MQGAQKLRSEAHLQVRRNTADGLFARPSIPINAKTVVAGCHGIWFNNKIGRLNKKIRRRKKWRNGIL